MRAGCQRGDVAATSAGSRRSARRLSALRSADSATLRARTATAAATATNDAAAADTAASDLREFSERGERSPTGGRLAARLRRRCDAGRSVASAAGVQLGPCAGHTVLQDRTTGSVSNHTQRTHIHVVLHTNPFRNSFIMQSRLGHATAVRACPAEDRLERTAGRFRAVRVHIDRLILADLDLCLF